MVDGPGVTCPETGRIVDPRPKAKAATVDSDILKVPVRDVIVVSRRYSLPNNVDYSAK
jgi:hypothetical protein